MTARDDLRAAALAWQVDHSGEHAGAMHDAAVCVLSLAEPSAREVLERLRDKLIGWRDDRSRMAAFSAACNDAVFECDRLLATLDAPQPEAPQPAEWMPSAAARAARRAMDVKAQPQPEPSGGAAEWASRMQVALGSKDAWNVETCDLVGEACRHWTDAECSGCAAADERAEIEAAEQREATEKCRPYVSSRHHNMRWSDVVIDLAQCEKRALGERDEARKERDAARAELHDAQDAHASCHDQLEEAQDRLVPTRERVYLHATIKTLARLLTEAKR